MLMAETVVKTDIQGLKLLARGKAGEFAAERGDSVRFVECIGE